MQHFAASDLGLHSLPMPLLQDARLRGLDALGRLSAIFNKGDNSCDFMFVTKPLLKMGLL